MKPNEKILQEIKRLTARKNKLYNWEGTLEQKKRAAKIARIVEQTIFDLADKLK